MFVVHSKIKLLIQLAVPPAKSPVHKTVSLEGDNNLLNSMPNLLIDIFFSPVSPFLKTCGDHDKKFRYSTENRNPETFCSQTFSQTFCTFSEAARKVGEIA